MKSIILFASIVAALSSLSRKKENDNAIPTILKGHVQDSIRGINISGYQIVLGKEIGPAPGPDGGTLSETVAEAYTDQNGDYSISFNYKLEPGQFYYWEEHNFRYYTESWSGSGPIVAGTTNIMNMNVWKPVQLKINAQVTNNIVPPLMIRNELAATHKSYLNVENIYQPDTSGTYVLWSRPKSEINIVFTYIIDYATPNPIRHEKIIPYHTTLDSTATLNYVIDCSRF